MHVFEIYTLGQIRIIEFRYIPDSNTILYVNYESRVA